MAEHPENGVRMIVFLTEVDFRTMRVLLAVKNGPNFGQALKSKFWILFSTDYLECFKLSKIIWHQTSALLLGITLCITM